MRFGRCFSIMVGLAAVMPLLSAAAHAADRFQGAWAADQSSCETAFVKRNGRLAVKQNTLEGLTGFIVTGKHIQGPHASCDVRATKQKGDVTTLLLGCKSQVIFDTMSVSIRFENDDSFVRLDPEFPEIETRYKRCNR